MVFFKCPKWHTQKIEPLKDTKGSERMNKAKLEYEMNLRGVSRSDLCKVLGISRSAFYRKCNGISEFTQGEIQKIVDCLNLKTPVGIFFDVKVS